MNNENMICTLLTSKSGISSISLSSDEEKKGDPVKRTPIRRSIACCDPGWIRPIAGLPLMPTRCIGLDNSYTSRITNTSSSYTCNPPPQIPAIDLDSIKPSTRVQGKLVARVLPIEYADYDTQKSMARIDPAPLIRKLSSKKSIEADASSSPITNAELQKVMPAPSQDETSSVVALDLYLVRSAFLRDAKNHLLSTNYSCRQAREDLMQNLMNSIDLSRNNSSHVGFESIKFSPSTIAQDNVFHLHMNRSSNESAARSLRRLEVSTTRKLKEIHPGSKKSMKENLSFLETGQSYCRLVDTGCDNDDAAQLDANADELGDEEDDPDGYSGHLRCNTIDISELNSADLWNKCADRQDNHWKVDLMLPSAITPFNTTYKTQVSPTPHQALLEKVQLDIISNPPTLLSIQTFENFTSHLFVGVPIVLQSTILYATHAIITWFVNGEVVMTDSNVYVPTMQDTGKRISVLVTPIHFDHDGSGCQEAYSFTMLVEPLPRLPILELRQNWINHKNDLRVLTYNILADLYAGREIDQQFMYSHCDSRHLLRKRRMPMIIAEILAYNADIICLQEVDASIHDTLLSPVLTACGFQGFYSNKVTAQQEGCSMFWSTASFDMASNNDMMEFPLRELLTNEKSASCNGDTNFNHPTQYYDAKSNLSELELERWESMHGINDLLEGHQEVRRIYKESVGQIVQVARLSAKRCKTDDRVPKSIVVANTHLFYHPMADHIRLLQAYAICHKLDEVRRENEHLDPVCLCGDFNSGPLSGAVRLLTNRSIAPNENDCWKHLNVYTWECGNSEYMLDHGYIGNTPEDLAIGDPLFIEEEFVDAHSDAACLDDSYFSDEDNDAVYPPTIVLPSCFPNLVSGCLEVPAFTNYAVDFVETLDYMFVSEPSVREPFGFKPLGEAPMPAEEMVKSLVAMPNELMPSDHVAIVCDFEWATNEEDRAQNL